MKQYDLIVGFGCSFTEGGGLDNPNIYKFINNIDDDTIGFMHPDTIKFKKDNNYIFYLSELFKCKFVNTAESMSSNDLIFKKIYEYFSNPIQSKRILMIGQMTMFTRQHVYYDNTNEFIKLNRTEFTEPPFNSNDLYKKLHEYYVNYLSFIYNEEVVVNNLKRDIELYDNWLKSKGIDTIWLSYDGDSSQFVESHNFIKFDDDNLGAWAEKNKMRIMDIPNCPVPDPHLSIEGHKEVAQRIYNKLTEIKLI
jgi:hypothetical protein